MLFNEHYKLRGTHARLMAPSQPYWLNYTDEKMARVFRSARAAEEGTRLHEFAQQAILLNRKQPNNGDSLNAYINDAIGFMMTPEQILYYSDNCYGSADSICFRELRLRIHDLKTGAVPGSFYQLEVYAALFCLEYDIDPHDIITELRIYQNNEVLIELADPISIKVIMNTIIRLNKVVDDMRVEGI